MTTNSRFVGVIAVTFLLASLFASAEAKDDIIVNTPRLIVVDQAGIGSQEGLDELAQEADNTLLNILSIWSAKPGIKKHGKIRLEFDRPLRGTRTSTFHWSKEKGRKVRVVKVFGVDKQPQGMAHKLTHAVFPNRDKLIRNMMGIYSENQVGNQNSFPMCGYSNDAWVQALLQLDSRIPLADLGPGHIDWGMEFWNKKPVVRDRARQHAAYAEAGSFGEYLIRIHGIEKMKQFYRLSLKKERPWKEAFGLSLEVLEDGWIRYLESEFETNVNEISVLKRLRKAHPHKACDNARSIEPERKRK
jgi:hypothetical protein